MPPTKVQIEWLNKLGTYGGGSGKEIKLPAASAGYANTDDDRAPKSPRQKLAYVDPETTKATLEKAGIAPGSARTYSIPEARPPETYNIEAPEPIARANAYSSVVAPPAPPAPAAGPAGAGRIDKAYIKEAKERAAKRFPDALAADPKMAKLLETRKSLTTKLSRLTGERGADEDAIRELVKQIEDADRLLEKAQAKLNASGVAPQQLRPNYVGEEKEKGWRTDVSLETLKRKLDNKEITQARYDELAAKVEQTRHSTERVTKYFDEGERKAAEITFAEDGTARGKTDIKDDGTAGGPEGKLRGAREFVMDEDGKLHQFQQKVRPTGKQFVSVTGKTLDEDAATHHSSILAGKAVANAGEMEFDAEGKLKKISNKSGHYKPGAGQMIQSLEQLAKQGALLDKTYVMADGSPLQGKAKALYEQVTKVQESLAKKIKDGKEIDAEVAAIAKAKTLLSKLGAAPSNKMRNVEVGFIEGADKKTGMGVHTAKQDVSSAGEFLSSGGGYVDASGRSQKANKGQVQDALKQKLAGTAAKLDQEAEQRATRVAAQSDELKATLSTRLDSLKKQLARLPDSQENKRLKKELEGCVKKLEAASKPARGVTDEDLNESLTELGTFVSAIEASVKRFSGWSFPSPSGAS